MNNLVDTSVFCGHWPFRNLPFRSPGELKAHLTARGVKEAWVTSAEALLYPDPMQGNVPLSLAVKGVSFFVPVALLDVTLEGWRKDVRECLEERGFRAFKLTPSYHSYSLSDSRVGDLAECAREAGVPVCIQVRMMDERSHHPLMKVPAVPAAEVAALAKQHPRTRFLACGADSGMLKKFADVENVWAELSFVESRNTLVQAIETLGPKRVVFGSHSPLLYFEASSAKLEAATEDVTAENLRAVAEMNAATLLGKR